MPPYSLITPYVLPITVQQFKRKPQVDNFIKIVLFVWNNVSQEAITGRTMKILLSISF